jgi:osmotically-inducible protein OsmY
MRTLLVVASLAGFLFAQARPAAKPAKPAPDAARDAQIEKDIRARFAKSKISRNNFQVRVQGGVATLEGQTDVIQHKGTATRLAKSGGARAVVNRIKVSQAARDKAARNLTEGRRRAQVKRSEKRDARQP